VGKREIRKRHSSGVGGNTTHYRKRKKRKEGGQGYAERKGKIFFQSKSPSGTKLCLAEGSRRHQYESKGRGGQD